MITRFSQRFAWFSIAMAACGTKDISSDSVRTAPPSSTIARPDSLPSGEAKGLDSITSAGLTAVTFARADSAARVVLVQAGIDPRRECVTGIARTDSSVILSYSVPHPPNEAPSGKRVLHYGGGLVVEVFASGRAKWVYGTQ